MYVGYLILAANGTSGSWDSPFKNPNNGNLKDVSHLNYYGWIDPRGGGNPPGEVPVPAAFLLMGTVLAGAGGIAGWRRR